MPKTTTLLSRWQQRRWGRRWVLTATPATDTDLSHEMARQWNSYPPTYRFRGGALRASRFYSRELRFPVRLWVRRVSEVDDGQ